MTHPRCDQLPRIYQDLLNNAQDILYYIQTQPEMKFLYVNEVVRDITGYTPEEHYQNPNLGFELVYPEDRHILQDLLAANEGFGNPIELRWQTKTGQTIWTEQINTPIFNDDHELIGIVGTARDITRRKEAENRIDDLHKLLPVCGYCHKIRNDDGIWQTVDQYIETELDSQVSHGICPTCAEQLQNQFDKQS